jgi:endonuclease YncB( thermonuclease family)
MHSPAPFVIRIVIVAAVAAAVSLAPRWGGRWAPPAPSQAGAALPQGPGMSGRVRVLDGDSLDLAGEQIRLFGIDAPESRQFCRDGAGRPYRCGRTATLALMAATAGRTVACTRVEHDRYDRQVAICTADGRDLGDTMVRAGLAVELPEYSGGRYAAAEREARAARRGLWAGSFERPRSGATGGRGDLKPPRAPPPRRAGCCA